MSKQLRLTLVCLTGSISALVELHYASSWSATASVELEGVLIQQSTVGHADERAALVAIAELLRRRFGASTTCFGSTVTIVGVSSALAAA